MDFSCPSCKSDNIQRLSVIYEGGLSNINTKSAGTAVGFGRGGIGVGVGAGKTTGVAQTAVSQKSAPPSKKRYLKPLLTIFVLFMFTSIMTIAIGMRNDFTAGVISIIWLAASVWWVYFAFQFNTKQWPQLKAIWDKSYLCNRCNEMFLLESH